MKGGRRMVNIIPVGTKGRSDVKIWLDEAGPEETRLFVAIAVGTRDGKTAKRIAEEAKNQEMLFLRKSGYEMPKNFKPEKIEQKIDGVDFQGVMYKFAMTDWKNSTMKK
jgi:hypothetical protein